MMGARRWQPSALSFELHQLETHPGRVFVVHTDIDGTQTFVDIPEQGEMRQPAWEKLHLDPAKRTITAKVDARKRDQAKANRHLTPVRAQ